MRPVRREIQTVGPRHVADLGPFAFSVSTSILLPFTRIRVFKSGYLARPINSTTTTTMRIDRVSMTWPPARARAHVLAIRGSQISRPCKNHLSPSLSLSPFLARVDDVSVWTRSSVKSALHRGGRSPPASLLRRLFSRLRKHCVRARYSTRPTSFRPDTTARQDFNVISLPLSHSLSLFVSLSVSLSLRIDTPIFRRIRENKRRNGLFARVIIARVQRRTSFARSYFSLPPSLSFSLSPFLRADIRARCILAALVSRATCTRKNFFIMRAIWIRCSRAVCFQASK